MHQSNTLMQGSRSLHPFASATRARTALAAGLLTGLLGASCGGASDGSDHETGSELSLQLFASPVAQRAVDAEDASPIRAAVVTIREVYLQPADGGERVVLRAIPVTTDLLTLADQTAELVAGRPVPSGKYESLRFVISGGYLDVAPDGIYATPGYDAVPTGRDVVGELVTPSFDQAGLKVKLPESTELEEPGPHRIVLVRFDVAESFGHKAGRSGRWVMHPVIEAEELDATALLLVAARRSARFELDAAALPWVELHDRHGNLEAAAPFEPASEPGLFTATLPYLLSAEGPFRARVVNEHGQALVTEPALPSELALSPGSRVELSVTLEGP